MVGVPLRGGAMPPLPPDGAGVYVGGTGGYRIRGSEGGSGDAAAHRTQLTRQVALTLTLTLTLTLPLTLTLTLPLT